jgi:NAD(P)-dependent dehydrogenase (short-subunit alcohol dehydrogenase family)
LQGRVAIVTGAASGIGAACAQQLLDQGAAVAWLDIHPDIGERSGGSSLGLRCDVTDSDAVRAAIEATVAEFGGIDIVVSNAGTFPPGMPLDRIDDDTWQRAIDINLSGHMRVMRSATTYLRHGLDPTVIVIGSKNVPAPGPGAAAYSAAKAALTQLARVAALELGSHGIRVNVIHPNAVFDTGIWTDDVVEERARSYGLSAEEYRANNVLGVAVRSTDVAAMATAMAGPAFARTTGAQVPVDGGNERVI